MSRLVVSLAVLFSQDHPKTPWASIFFQWNPEKVANRVIICSDFGSMSILSYIVKDFKLDFLKKALPKKY